jgi:hypothetical protein
MSASPALGIRGRSHRYQAGSSSPGAVLSGAPMPSGDRYQFDLEGLTAPCHIA